jgi:hypothetical protein
MPFGSLCVDTTLLQLVDSLSAAMMCLQVHTAIFIQQGLLMKFLQQQVAAGRSCLDAVHS